MAPVQSRLVLAVGFSALATAATALFVVVGLLWKRESRRPDPDKDEPPDRATLDTSESFTDSALNESSKLIESLVEEPSSKVSDSGLVSDSFVSGDCSADFDVSIGDFKLTLSELQSDSNSFYESSADTPGEISSCSLQKELSISKHNLDLAAKEECPRENLTTKVESGLPVGEVLCLADSSNKEDSTSVNHISLEEFLLFKEFIEDILETPEEGIPSEGVVVSVKEAESTEILPDSVTEEKCSEILVEDLRRQEDTEQVSCQAMNEGLNLEVLDQPTNCEEVCKEEPVETPAEKSNYSEVSVDSTESKEQSPVCMVGVKIEDCVQESPLETVEKIVNSSKPLSETSKQVEVCKKVEIPTLKTEVSKDITSVPEKRLDKARKVPVTVVNNLEKVEPACVVKPVKEDFIKKKMSGEVLCEKERKEGSEKGELAGLELESMKEGGEGRDSANHSPSEVMLASPSISSFSDAHSEGSSDSGKGHSDVATSPSRTPAGGSSLAGEDNVPNLYEFVIPQVIVGRLIGRHGSFLHEIMGASHTNIYIKKHPDSNKLKICAIEGGSQQDIDKALEMIRHKFPLRRYPKVTLERVSFSSEQPHQLRAEDFHLSLVEGVNNDVVLSSLMSAGQFFVQQPSHPSYQCLTSLTQALTQLYSLPDQPQLSSPIKDAICVAPSMGGWYRAQIVAVSDDAAHCDIKFLDYGGYVTVETVALRQIRGDFMMLPFQAIECGLANIAPTNEEGWSEESRAFVHNLTFGRLLQVQVCTYTEEGVPLVNVYTTYGPQVILLNNELVAQGFARFLEITAASE